MKKFFVLLLALIFWGPIIYYQLTNFQSETAVLSNQSKTVVTSGEIILSVDYSKTLDLAIADGKYDRVDSAISVKNFPVVSGIKVAIFTSLFQFVDGDISSEDVIKEMDRRGFRPATLMELLALGETHPELQRQFPIIALGTI